LKASLCRLRVCLLINAGALAPASPSHGVRMIDIIIVIAELIGILF